MISQNADRLFDRAQVVLKNDVKALRVLRSAEALIKDPLNEPQAQNLGNRPWLCRTAGGGGFRAIGRPRGRL
jgi:hypothetical protein